MIMIYRYNFIWDDNEMDMMIMVMKPGMRLNLSIQINLDPPSVI